MGTRNMAYDHPAYTAVGSFSASAAAGASASLRFAAFADMIARTLWIKPATPATSADTVTVFAVTNTTTKTLGVTTIASAQTTFARLELTTASRTLTAGDELRVTLGTDATKVYAVGVDYTLVPGANLTD
jgi:hypothetical protein